MSMAKNQKLIPPPVRMGVTGFSLVAIVVVGLIFLVSREVAHILWVVVGVTAFAIAGYLFYLRSRDI